MPLTIVRNDITKLRVDAIVNAANTSLQMGGGVCGAIFSAAGAGQLQRACDELAPIRTGEAVITQGFDLPAKYVIHTAGPIYHDGKQGEESLLRSCYINSLEIALKHDCGSIAFPLISSGIYGYPKAEALRVATAAISEFTGEHDIDVLLVVFDKSALVISEELLGEVKSYIDEHYVEERQVRRRTLSDIERRTISDAEMKILSAPMPRPMVSGTAFDALVAEHGYASFEDYVGKLDEPFSATLLRLIDATGRKDSEVYRRANIDRRLFSKIRGNTDYAPSKPTVLAFAVALELTLDQTADLLGRAGFALSHSRVFDVIVEYFIKTRKYDIFQINEVLFSYDQPLLGG
ncbi:MAG: macro domain-containing protein [Oscillospiraceae bacterium]|jgi:O-acetyl-ADP-ribose deacetylase (regulator of RNase III)|nr:macro domain-containing protein [Oscillospiraceae bacterium]